MFHRIEGIVATVLVASRWLMAPVYLGLVAALVIVLVEFLRELVHTVAGFGNMAGREIILAVLKLIDLVLIGNLIQIITVAGVAAFISKAAVVEEAAREWMGKLDFSGLKLKVLASLAAIAAVDLLESFFNIESMDKRDVLWEILIMLSFAVAGLLLAWVDRLTSESH